MIASEPIDRARELGRESKFLTLCRIGFAGRGLLYILIALLVLRSGRTEDFSGVFRYLNEGAGRLLLMVIAAGLAAYGLWRLADAAFGIDNGANAASARGRRAGAAGIGGVYLYLSYKAAHILLAGHPPEMSPREEAALVLDLPGGTLLLGLIALGLIAGGLGQLWLARTRRFLGPLDRRALSTAVRLLGQLGYAARGLVFIAVGLLLGGAAIDGRSAEAGGVEQALDLFGGPALPAIAAGLLLFGLFSLVEALYRRLPEPPPATEIKRRVEEKLG